MLVTLCKKVWAGRIRTRNISSLLTATARSYATISPHQLVLRCKINNRLSQIVGQQKFFCGFYKSSSLFLRLITPFSFAICEMFCLSSENQVTSCTEPAA